MNTGAWIEGTSWPTWEQLLRVLSFRDYNTRVVVVGTLLLGLAGGIIGTFMLLRKRALVADAISHATLPGIGLAFMVMVYAGGSGKFLPGLLAGALISGLAGMGLIILIRKVTRLKEDAALGIVLSVFFGLGIAILGVIQKMTRGHAAGLESFIYGKTASMLASDALMIAAASLVIIVLSTLLFKEFNLICFDPDFAAAQGWPVVKLDMVMMGLVVAVTVIGLQSVGLILVIALLIIPPAAARFWTDHLPRMTVAAGLIGAASGLFGATLSALVPRLPAGAIIVVVASFFFLVSLIFGPARGVLIRLRQQRGFNRKVARQHLLRAVYEYLEESGLIRSDRVAGILVPEGAPDEAVPQMAVPEDHLLEARSWTPGKLKSLLRSACRDGLLRPSGGRETAGGRRPSSSRGFMLTGQGWEQAKGIVRNHRLWELYLIRYADVATSRVDRDADQIEHVLGRRLVEELERVLAEVHPELVIPPSPHRIHGPSLQTGM